jgi:hypothetical protein
MISSPSSSHQSGSSLTTYVQTSGNYDVPMKTIQIRMDAD